jgi:hypothetical protein
LKQGKHSEHVDQDQRAHDAGWRIEQNQREFAARTQHSKDCLTRDKMWFQWMECHRIQHPGKH